MRECVEPEEEEEKKEFAAAPSGPNSTEVCVYLASGGGGFGGGGVWGSHGIIAGCREEVRQLTWPQTHSQGDR